VGLKAPFAARLGRVRAQHRRYLGAGRGSVELPSALTKKHPLAAWAWAWQRLFPATRFYLDPPLDQYHRHHFHASVLQRVVKEAARTAGPSKPASCHTLWNAFATHLLECG
jgi:hypothetical protein